MKKYEKKIAELPNTVDTLLYSPDSNKRAKSDPPLILFVGGLDSAHYFKGVDILLQAGAALVDSGKKFQICIIGDGDMRPVYEAHARSLGLEKRVFFAGSVGREQLPGWYSRALCTVLPSIDSTEAFGVVLIEAGACGTPVIATTLPGVRSVVQDSVTGYLIPPHDISALASAIDLFLSHPERAEKMGRAGAARVQEYYSYEHVAKKFIVHLGT